MINISIGIFLLCSPIVFLSLAVPSLPTLQFYQFGYFSNSVNLVQLQLFCFWAILLVVASLFDTPRRNFRDEQMKWLLLISTVSVYLHPKTIKLFPVIFLGFLLYYVVSVCADTNRLRMFFWAIASVAVLNTVFAVLQSLNIHLIYHAKENGEIVGLMGYKTQLGIYQALSIPVCFALNPWLAVIPTIGLFLSKSGTSILACIVGLSYFFRRELWKYGSMPIYMASSSLILFFIVRHYHQLTLRFGSWLEAINGIFKHPIAGNGFGTFDYVEKRLGGDVFYSDPYNLYLGVFYAIGVLGLVVFVVFLKDKLFLGGQSHIVHEAVRASCLILVVVGFGYSFMDYPRLAGTAIVLFGLLTALKPEVST